MSDLPFIMMPSSEWESIKNILQSIGTTVLEIKQKNSKEFLTMAELCQKLKCSHNTAKNYINAGHIVGIDKNPTGRYRKWLFKNADVDYFMQNNPRK